MSVECGWVQALSREGRINEALGLVDEAKKHGALSSGLFATLAKAAGEAGLRREVLMLHERMQREQMVLTESVHGSFVAAFVSLREEAFAETALQRGRKAKPPNEKAGVRAYTPLMQLYAKQGRRRDAWGILRVLKTDGLQPTRVTYSALADGFAESGLLEDAEAAVTELEMKGLRPNSYTYNALIRARGKYGYPSTSAIATWKRMEQSGVESSIETFNTALDAMRRAGECKEALRSLQRMRRRGVEFDNATYTILIKFLGEQGMLKSAIAIFAHLRISARDDHATWNATIGILARAGR